MTEYTSHDLTTRLLGVGFKEPPDTRVVDVNVLPWRSDTLLAWLLGKGWRCDEQYRDSACYVLADLYGDYSPIHRHEEAHAPTLSDALAEVVLKVLEATHA